jgi:hypothetical protein
MQSVAGPSRTSVTTVDYPRHWFVIGTISLALLTVVDIYLEATAKEDFSRGLWILLLVVLTAFLFLFFIPPVFTKHLLGAKGIRIRMGLLINVSVPYSWIREVKETTVRSGGLRIGIGVKYSPIMSTVFVTSSFMNLVSIRLDKEHEFGRLPIRRIDQIVLSVNDLNSFMKTVRQKAGLKEV